MGQDSVGSGNDSVGSGDDSEGSGDDSEGSGVLSINLEGTGTRWCSVVTREDSG